MAHRLLGTSSLGASSFFTSATHPDACGENGLPLTPKAVQILGRFQKIKEISHKNLCTYLDLVRVKKDRLIQVCEYHSHNLEENIQSGSSMGVLGIQKTAYEVLEGLVHLNDNGLVHRMLCPENILLSEEGVAKLHNHGLYHMTDCGKDVSFPIGHPRYLAPEVIAAGLKTTTPSGPKSDVWSLGIILLEMFLGHHIFRDLSFPNGLTILLQRIMRTIHTYHKNSKLPLDSLLKDNMAVDKVLDPELRSFLQACLHPLPTKRPTPKQLLDHTFFQTMDKVQPSPCWLAVESPFSLVYRTKDLDVGELTGKHHITRGRSRSKVTADEDFLAERLIQEVYYLWSLAGGDLEMELKRSGVIKLQPPICLLPNVVTREGGVFGLENDITQLFDSTTVVLPLTQLRKRLEHLTVLDYCPVLEYYSDANKPQLVHDESSLPITIKEANVEYQFHRLVLFKRLLDGYPYTAEMILSEAKVDVCPLYRGQIWAAILNVKGDIQSEYRHIDKDMPHSTDRQIAVDIPRCHQYHPMMSSPIAHNKLKRVLKAWVVTHSDLVYWQGLDSLCAPFVTLNFENEALAWASLSAFVDKYLHGFFLKDNSLVMQEYLAIFSQLVSFHDPELFVHLDEIGFQPQLYAIPWFLTMFTHVLSLSKIYHLWDVLLLRDQSFPLCVGLALLSQIRHCLLGYDFNECILFFSDMPDIDIQNCIQDALKFFHNTPPSIFMREHGNGRQQPEDIPQEAGYFSESPFETSLLDISNNKVVSQLWWPSPPPSKHTHMTGISGRKKVPLSVGELLVACSPQISPHDLIVLSGLESFALGYEVPPTSGQKKSKRHKIITIDTRPHEDYQRGHVPQSVNLPEDQAFSVEGSLLTTPTSQLVHQMKGRSVFVVLSNTGDRADMFAQNLVRCGFPKVCTLQGGAVRLRNLGLLADIGT